MRSLASAMALAMLMSTDAPAQEPGGRIALGILSGGVAFSDLQRTSGQHLTQPGADRLDRAISAEPTLVGGVGLSVWPRESWGIRLHYYGARSTLSTYAMDERGAETAAEGAGRHALATDFLAADFAFRLPIQVRRVATYGVLGAGAVRYRAEPEEGTHALPTRTRAIGTAGVGARVPMRPGSLDLEFEIADHVARAPWSAAEVGGAQELTTTSADGATAREVEIVNHVRFSVGFRISLHSW